MGTVHLGRLVGAGGFSRVVAIKRLFPGFAGDRMFRQWLLDEARLASRIRHPNVVPILDVVEAGSDLYVVMEYVHGVSLAELLVKNRGQPIPVDIAVTLAEGILLGLHAAHEARGEDGTPLGIVHRDVSPQNILVGADGIPRLIDFGIAKAANSAQVTDPGVLKGKAGYMSPEQLRQRAVTRQADVYAASIVLWEMLTGQRLFSVLDVTERLGLLGEDSAAPSTLRTDVDPGLDLIVVRGLADDPARRFPNAEAMALALRDGRPPSAAAEVARWLAGICIDDLEISEERVRLLEQAPASSPLSGARAADRSGSGSLAASMEVESAAAQTTFRPLSRRGRAWVPMTMAALAVAGSIAALVFSKHPASATGPALPVPVETAAALTPDPAAPRATPPPAPPAATPPPPALPSAAAPATAAGSPSPSTPPASRAAASHPRRTKAKCDPPYTVDANGFKHYDRGCF